MKPASTTCGPAMAPDCARSRSLTATSMSDARSRTVVMPNESCIGPLVSSLVICMWPCISHMPGMTVLPAASMTVAPCGARTHDAAFTVENVAVDDGQCAGRRLLKPLVERLGLRVTNREFRFAQGGKGCLLYTSPSPRDS